MPPDSYFQSLSRRVTKLMSLEFWHEHAYVGTMAAASFITIARSLLLAGALTADHFALYASAFACAQFASTFLSFGLVERTSKNFVHSAESNDFAEILRASKDHRKTIQRRGLALAAILLMALLSTNKIDWIAPGVILIALSITTAFSGILASSLRATDETNRIANWSISRSILTFVAAGIAAYAWGWQAALLGELLGSLLTLIVFQAKASHGIRSRIPNNLIAGTGPENHGKAVITDESSGLWLALAFWLGAIPVYLDRWYVTSFSSPSTAATYAIAAVVVSCVTTLSGIFVQKVGPDLIRQGIQRNWQELQRIAFRYQLVIALAGVVGTTAVACLLQTQFAEDFRIKYALTWPVCIVLIFVTSIQVTQFTDWALIALNREIIVTVNAVVFLVVVAIGFTLAANSKTGPEGYLMTVGIARTAQLLTAWWFVLKPQSSSITR